MADPSRTASVGDGLDGLKRVGLPASAHQRHARATRRHRRGVSADTARGPETGVYDIRGTTRRRFAAKEKRRDQFLAAGQAGLKSRAPDARDEEHQRLHAKVGELLMENELLYAKVDHLEAGVPLARRRSTR